MPMDIIASNIMEIEERLNKIYHDNPVGFQAFRRKVKDIPLSVVKEFYKRQTLPELNAIPKTTKSYKITAPSNSYQIDVTHMPYRSRGYGYFLTCIEITSRMAYVYPMKDMTIKSLLKSLSDFVRDTTVERIESDNQFNIKAIKDFCNEHDIKLFTIVADEEHISNGNKLGIIDAFTRTLKRRLRNYLIQHNSQDYITPLHSIVNDYNNSYHTTLKDTPAEVSNDDNKMANIQVHASHYNRDDSGLPIGGNVRHIERKGIFEKEGPRFSESVHQIVSRKGNRYEITDGTRLYKPSELIQSNSENKISSKKLKRIIKAVKIVKNLRREGIDQTNVIHPMLQRKRYRGTN